jgi:hypothetical protein
VAVEFGDAGMPEALLRDQAVEALGADRHVANALAKPTPRGWRLVKSAEAAQSTR